MLKVVKIGGNIVDNPAKLDKFLADFALLRGNKILVHGGGKVATTISQALGIETQMVNGRRVTDAETLRVVTMVYAGVINKTIVNKLNALGCSSIGLSGADGEFIVANKRSPTPVDYGFVGDPKTVNCKLINTLQSSEYTIVAAPITTDGAGQLLNTNADTIAQSIATAMAQSVDNFEPDSTTEQVELIYCFEKRGVLRDVNDDNSVIDTINKTDFEQLKAKGIVAEGMLPKLENAFKAIDCGVSRVVICSAEMIATENYGGTVITGSK